MYVSIISILLIKKICVNFIEKLLYPLVGTALCFFVAGPQVRGNYIKAP